jgi:hypothetical protein
LEAAQTFFVAFEALPAFFRGHCRHQIFVAGETEIAVIDAFQQDFEPEATFVLQAAQFVHRAFEDSVGFGAGAVDGDLRGHGDQIHHGVEVVEARETVFDAGTAAKTVRSAGDFVSEGLFEGSQGREVSLQAGDEFVDGYCFVRIGFVLIQDVTSGE